MQTAKIECWLSLGKNEWSSNFPNRLHAKTFFMEYSYMEATARWRIWPWSAATLNTVGRRVVPGWESCVVQDLDKFHPQFLLVSLQTFSHQSTTMEASAWNGQFKRVNQARWTSSQSWNDTEAPKQNTCQEPWLKENGWQEGQVTASEWQHQVEALYSLQNRFQVLTLLTIWLAS